jgi:hypothetical protein
MACHDEAALLVVEVIDALQREATEVRARYRRVMQDTVDALTTIDTAVTRLRDAHTELGHALAMQQSYRVGGAA